MLDWAARYDRVVLTHDVNTFLHYAFERVAASQPMAGVIAVPMSLSIGRALEDIPFLAEMSGGEEFVGRVLYLPM